VVMAEVAADMAVAAADMAVTAAMGATDISRFKSLPDETSERAATSTVGGRA
jgi:hypothetical protein